MDFQKLMQIVGDTARQTRSDYHLTLGSAIERLKGLNESLPVRFDSGDAPGDVMSYRGYYADLAIEPGGGLDTVEKLLGRLQDALGAEFTGYKGGEFLMDEETPLWRAEYGNTGQAIIDMRLADGGVVLVTKQL